MDFIGRDGCRRRRRHRHRRVTHERGRLVTKGVHCSDGTWWGGLAPKVSPEYRPFSSFVGPSPAISAKLHSTSSSLEKGCRYKKKKKKKNKQTRQKRYLNQECRSSVRPRQGGSRHSRGSPSGYSRDQSALRAYALRTPGDSRRRVGSIGSSARA